MFNIEWDDLLNKNNVNIIDTLNKQQGGSLFFTKCYTEKIHEAEMRRYMDIMGESFKTVLIFALPTLISSARVQL